MKTLALAIISLLVASAPAVYAANDPADEKALMATLDALAKATITKDIPTLEKVLGDDITFSHSAAMTQTKAQVLKAIAGPGVATFMTFTDQTIRIYGNVALVKGVVDFQNGVSADKLFDNHLNILWVLVRRPQGPFGWQIVARQTTRIGPSLGTPVPPKKK